MDLCVAIETQEDVTWEDWTALAEGCERHGVPALYCSDHYLSTAGDNHRGSLDAWGTVCALGAVTSSVRLGTLVSPTSFRHPSVLAKLAITADHVSGGRIDLGMGAGWHEAEHRALGLAFPDLRTRIEIFEEQVEVVSGLLGSAPLTYSGRHYAYAGVEPRPKPVRGRIPLILGGSAGPRAAATAARWADEYNTATVDPAECRRRRCRLDVACEAIGRDPKTLRLSLRIWLLVGRDDDELRERARALGAVRGASGREPDDVVRELGASGSWIIGTLDAAAHHLRALAVAGADRFVLALAVHRDLDQLAVVARELSPRVALPA
jgi:alkanesulfonate monooxygenase SsuD/methylene tetrahydromethanopterin reductase-like flavin-dependent oxidoreductase (luciferase family)